jgi:hypothetical protein
MEAAVARAVTPPIRKPPQPLRVSLPEARLDPTRPRKVIASPFSVTRDARHHAVIQKLSPLRRTPSPKAVLAVTPARKAT